MRIIHLINKKTIFAKSIEYGDHTLICSGEGKRCYGIPYSSILYIEWDI